MVLKCSKTIPSFCNLQVLVIIQARASLLPFVKCEVQLKFIFQGSYHRTEILLVNFILMIWPNDLELGHYNGFVLNAFSFDIALMGKGYA